MIIPIINPITANCKDTDDAINCETVWNNLVLVFLMRKSLLLPKLNLFIDFIRSLLRAKSWLLLSVLSLNWKGRLIDWLVSSRSNCCLNSRPRLIYHASIILTRWDKYTTRAWAEARIIGARAQSWSLIRLQAEIAVIDRSWNWELGHLLDLWVLLKSISFDKLITIIHLRVDTHFSVLFACDKCIRFMLILVSHVKWHTNATIFDQSWTNLTILI